MTYDPLQTPKLAYKHARYHLKGRRFEPGEPVIARDGWWAYLYALHIIHGPFELGELAIAQRAQTAYLYAAHVLHGEFELGEQAIYSDPTYWLLYCGGVIHRLITQPVSFAKVLYYRKLKKRIKH